MVEEQPRFNLISVIWSAVLVFIVPVVLTILTTFTYGLYVGFQSRGDQAIITQSVTAFASSVGFMILSLLLLALVVFWRGRVLARQMGRAALVHVIAAVVIALLIRLALDLISANIQITSTLLAWVVALGVAVLAITTAKAPEPQP